MPAVRTGFVYDPAQSVQEEAGTVHDSSVPNPDPSSTQSSCMSFAAS
jgi:hypothetical protein